MRDWIEICKRTPIKDRADIRVVIAGLKSLLGVYTAVSDLPPILFTEELAQLFPDAHVICTIRDPQSWWDSVRAVTSKTDSADRDERIHKYLLMLVPRMRYWDALNQVLKRGRMGQLYYLSGHRYLHAGQYRAHLDSVTRVVPPERLELYDVKHGWQPLSKLLCCKDPDVPVCSVSPVSHMNDAQVTEQIVLTQVRRGVLSWRVIGVGVIFVAYLTGRRWS
jgi:hypothetical protein